MKKLLISLYVICIGLSLIAQQVGPITLKSKKLVSKQTEKKVLMDFDLRDSVEVEKTKEITETGSYPILLLYGIGNLNQESFSSLNSSGKASFLFIPYYYNDDRLQFNISINKNASNNDSLLASTLLFPEIGDHSFLGTIEFIKKLNDENDKFHTKNFLSGFFEFSYKKIKIDEQDTVKNIKTTRSFATLNFTLGSKLAFAFQKNEFTGSFSLCPYISWFNIPNEDQEDFREVSKRNFKFINNNHLDDHFTAIGIKTIFEINSFQLYADFRHVIRKETIPALELRGLKANIGVVFNANILTAKL